MCKTNPQYSYVEMGKVNTAELPSRLLRPGTSEGYFCELRVQVAEPNRLHNRSSVFCRSFLPKLFAAPLAWPVAGEGERLAPSLLA